ncbi:unnamed protein product [Schistocephalus solidus]|uniref:C2H2-type domain-containing protein n=1 Tax=Schistocephalus solidus TaxID=70667 RepID=A0A183SE11_SCHSO|nr:unnamed protein product [Schistocephalus solidus]
MPHCPRSPTTSSLLHPLRRSRRKKQPYPTPTTSVTTSNTTIDPGACDGDSVLTCRHCDRTFTSHIYLVGHLRIHRTESDELVPGTPTHNRDCHLQYPQSPAHSLIAWA